MTKKAVIIVNLIPEASKSTIIEIEKTIRNGASIPWSKNIENISIQDTEKAYYNLKKQGLSKNVARSLIKMYMK
ncbi:hypothetical protein KJN74_01470 [Candidatus Bathyarchaeota archaeon]|nr:hypothetical protein [Candidatus Bathyarchaeota archaeon]